MREALLLVESNTSGTGRLFASAARRQGLEPVLLAVAPGRYPFASEDGVTVVECETREVAAVLETAGRLRCAGLHVAGVTSSSEYFIAISAEVAGALGLPGPRPESVAACQDKALQARRLLEAGVAIPRFALAETEWQAVDAAHEVGFPVVVKPTHGSGSVNVRLCTGVNDVRGHAGGALAGANERGMLVPRRVLVQSFVDGPEYSIETFGEQVVGITRKHLGRPPCFVETGHDFPAAIDGATAQTLGRCALAAIRALGLGWGAAHVESRLVEGRAVVMEVNPRLAGGFIPEMIRHACGLDLVSAQVAAALGGKGSSVPVIERFTAIRFLVVSRAARIGSHEAVKTVGRQPGVIDVQVYRREGMVVEPAGDFRDRVGHVLAAGATPGAASAAAANGLARLNALLEPAFNGMLHER